MTCKRLVQSKSIPLSHGNLLVKYFVLQKSPDGNSSLNEDSVSAIYGLAIEQQQEQDPLCLIREEATHYFLSSSDEAMRLAHWLADHEVTVLSMLAVLSDLIPTF